MSAVNHPNRRYTRSQEPGSYLNASRVIRTQVSLGLAALAITVMSSMALYQSAKAQGAAAAPAAFASCLACHTVGAGAENKNGPVLNGIIGKPVASAAGFTYSDAFQAAKAAGLVWSGDNLDKYLIDSTTFLPGSHMAWAVPDAAQRQAIIAYLKTLP